MMFLFNDRMYQMMYQSVNQLCVNQSGEFSIGHMVFIELYVSNPVKSLSKHEIAGSFAAKPGEMETTTKPEKQQPSSIGVLQKVLIFVVVLAVCVGFFVGLELVKTRLISVEQTVNGLSKVCKRPSWGNHSNQRNRRDTGSVSLEDVRSEIQTQLRSITASQLCSSKDKICLAGPPGAKGELGDKGRRGKKGYSGVKGDAGYPGPKGLDGHDGIPGQKGSTGFPGVKGERGNDGLRGLPGPNGDDGGIGPAGVIGETGIPGIDGLPGEKGEPGAKGEKGDTIVRGSSGIGSPGKAPTIYVSPSTLTVREGSSVKFNCYAFGQPEPIVRWEKLGRRRVSQGPSRSLTITKASSWHSGKYKCRASNLHGSKEAIVELKVKGKPEIAERFLSRSVNTTVIAYDDVTIFCHVEGYPVPEVKWFKADGTKLPEVRIEIRNDSLVMRKIRVEESGIYVCRAQNLYGEVEMRFPVSVIPRSGLDRYDATRNCTELKAQIPSTLSGKYWIDPDLGSSDNAFEVYCDQETDGGGWTLVWSYQFKRDYWFSSPYETYMSPRPSFPLQYRSSYMYMSPLSTTLPLNPSTPGAMNFSLWKTLGNEMLLKSDLINWYVCQDGSGSILKWNHGSISCRVARTLVDKCNNTAPSHFEGDNRYGIKLSDGPGGNYFYKVAVMAWNGNVGGRILDSCANSGKNFVKELNDPRGAWFVR